LRPVPGDFGHWTVVPLVTIFSGFWPVAAGPVTAGAGYGAFAAFAVVNRGAVDVAGGTAEPTAPTAQPFSAAEIDEANPPVPALTTVAAWFPLTTTTATSAIVVIASATFVIESITTLLPA
jgi:hypothetical protein